MLLAEAAATATVHGTEVVEQQTIGSRFERADDVVVEDSWARHCTCLEEALHGSVDFEEPLMDEFPTVPLESSA